MLSNSTLFQKVNFLLVIVMLLSGVGCYTGMGIAMNGWVQLGLFLALIAGIFAVAFVVHANVLLGTLLLFGWSFLFGLIMGPGMQVAQVALGSTTIMWVFLGTAVVLCVCGGIGAFSGHDFSGWGRWLMLGLFGLIIAGIIGIFLPMSKGVEIVYSLIGMAIFAGYMMYDYWQVAKGENTWPNAVLLSMSIMLDVWNFAWKVIEFLLALKRKD